MPRSRRQCRICYVMVSPSTPISASGLCPTCRRWRIIALADAMDQVSADVSADRQAKRATVRPGPPDQ